MDIGVDSKWYYLLIILLIAFSFYIFATVDQTGQPQRDNKTKPFTLEDVAKFDGKNGQKTYIALYGYVFDVSSSPNFSQGGSYAHFAGHDISIACANHSTDQKYVGQHFDPNEHSLDAS